MDNRDVILGEIQLALDDVMGKASASVMRRAGMKASRVMWPELPEGLSSEEAGEVMAMGIEGLGSFGKFSITGEDQQGTVKIEFTGCYFATLAGHEGENCGKQPICHFGFGLVEETFNRLTGKRTKVRLTHHDPKTHTCHETATPR